jgi:prevent-host-death family protein
MKVVRISELRNRLSQHLRRVRRGHSLLVLYRDTPIARIVPYRSDADELVIHPARRRFAEARKALRLRPPPVPTDSLAALLEERGER